MKLFALLIFTIAFACSHGFAKPPADLNSREITGPQAVGLQHDEGSVYNLSTAFSNSLARAVSSIGKGEAVLNVDADTVVSTDLTIPPNIVLNFPSTAMISVEAGKNLTISAMTSPGNRKIFAGAGNVRLDAQAVERLNMTWWAGTDASVDATAAINAALASLSFSTGGVLYVPCGIWKTKGGHLVPQVATIQGCGDYPDALYGTVFQLTNAGASYVFKNQTEAFRTIKMRDFSINLGTATAARGIFLDGNAPNGGVGFEASNISVSGAAAGAGSIGFAFDATDGTQDMMEVSLENCRFIVGTNQIGVLMDTHNGNFRFTTPYFYMANGATAIKALSSAGVKVTAPVFLGATTPPPAPIETVNRSLTANITIGTTALTLSRGNFTVNDIGQKVVIAGKLDSYITEVLTQTTATVATNATGTSAGDLINIYRTSSDKGQAYAGFWNAGDYTNIEIENAQDEGLQYFFINQGNHPYTGIITFRNCYIQAPILNKNDAVFTSVGNHYQSLAYYDDPGGKVQTEIYSLGDKVMNKTMFYGNGPRERILVEPRIQAPHAGVMSVNTGFYRGATGSAFSSEAQQRFWQTYSVHSPSPALASPVVSIGMADQFLNSGKPWLELASLNSNSDTPSLSYRFARDATTGYMTVSGSQKGYVGYDFNGPIYSSSGGIRSAAVQLIDEATITANPKDGENFYVTLGGNRTLKLSPMTEADQSRTDGATIQFEIIQDGTGNRNVSLATGAAGQFAFGTDIPRISLTPAAGKRDILTAKYSKRLDRWMVIDFKRGF
jgi:hypothetical protein